MSIAKFLLTLGLAGAALSANAGVDVNTVNVTSGFSSPESGATVVTFDSAIPSGVLYSGGGAIVSGNVGSEYAAPPIGGGLYDTTNYFTLGTSAYQSGTATLTFSGQGASYFGFYLGSPDSYNSITFNGSDGTHTTLSGTQLVSYSHLFPPIGDNGDQSQGFYFGVKSTAGSTFTSITMTSTTNAMETDNHAFLLAPVPEPETYAMLLAGLGLIGFLRRRKA